MLWRQLYSKFFRVFLLSGHTSNKKTCILIRSKQTNILAFSLRFSPLNLFSKSHQWKKERKEKNTSKKWTSEIHCTNFQIDVFASSTLDLAICPLLVVPFLRLLPVQTVHIRDTTQTVLNVLPYTFHSLSWLQPIPIFNEFI